MSTETENISGEYIVECLRHPGCFKQCSNEFVAEERQACNEMGKYRIIKVVGTKGESGVFVKFIGNKFRCYGTEGVLSCQCFELDTSTSVKCYPI